MRTDRIKLGVVGGIVGGMAIAMWMMLYYLGAHRGFWAPVGYIGHVLVRGAAVRSPGAVVAGILIHMMVSMGLGALVAQAFRPSGLLVSTARASRWRWLSGSSCSTALSTQSTRLHSGA